MRRIEFIEPVKAMRGNLTGKVALLYAQNNNPAFYAPEGKQFARNYGPSYIGNKRASDDHKYFSVKTKSATKIDAATLMQMAVFGGTGSLIGAMYSNKASSIYIQAAAVYALLKQNDPLLGSFRKWLSAELSEMLALKNQTAAASAQTPAGVTVNWTLANLFVSGQQQTGAELSEHIILKFWKQLAKNGVEYKVNGLNTPIIAFSDTTFTDLFDLDINFAGLQGISQSGGVTAVGIVTPGAPNKFLNVKDNAGIVGHDYTATENDMVALQQGNTYYLGDTYIPAE